MGLYPRRFRVRNITHQHPLSQRALATAAAVSVFSGDR